MDPLIFIIFRVRQRPSSFVSVHCFCPAQPNGYVRVQEAAYTRIEILDMLKKAGLSPLKTEVNRKLEGKTIRMPHLVRKA